MPLICECCAHLCNALLTYERGGAFLRSACHSMYPFLLPSIHVSLLPIYTSNIELSTPVSACSPPPSPAPRHPSLIHAYILLLCNLHSILHRLYSAPTPKLKPEGELLRLELRFIVLVLQWIVLRYAHVNTHFLHKSNTSKQIHVHDVHIFILIQIYGQTDTYIHTHMRMHTKYALT